MQVGADQEWEFVRKRGRVVRFSDGRIIGLEGADERSVILIESGQVKIVLTSQEGRQVTVGLRREGEFIGEMSAIGDCPRSATMLARGQVVAYELSQQAFLDYLAEYPDAALRVMRGMARRIRQVSAMYLSRGESLSGRVAATLLRLASAENGLRLKITQQELADWVGASREATGRVIASLREDGLISTGRGSITVLDVPGLTAAGETESL